MYVLLGISITIALLLLAKLYRRRILADANMRAIEETEKAVESANAELQLALTHLTEAQDQLIHTEKMASLGQLTAGIAHEIKNPLNFVNNFAVLSKELLDELEERIPSDEEARKLIHTLKSNNEKIAEHGRRADGIIRSMLAHSRTGRGQRSSEHLNKLVEEYLNLSLHGLQAQLEDVVVTCEKHFDDAIGEVEMYPQEIGRVLINLLDNAFYAVKEKSNQADQYFEPKVIVQTRFIDGRSEIWIEDNGVGVPYEDQVKVFQPFYTTKPTGRGTGLGLSLSHDIMVKGHGGALLLESEAGKGAKFIVRFQKGGF